MSKRVVIFVDDEKIVLNSIKDQLRRNFNREISFESAQSAEEAMDLLEELEESGIVVPLIISDQIMPNMKGDELLTKVHERFPDMKKILLTGQADSIAVGNAVNNAHLYRFISKPWLETDLAQTVKGAIDSYEKSEHLNALYNKLEELTKVVGQTFDGKEVDSEATEDKMSLLQRGIVQLVEAKENAESATQAKAHFLSTMSHELRTPLSGIIGISRILEESDPKPEQEENISVLNFSSRTLLALINDILDFSKIEAGKVTLEAINVDLSDLSKNILKIHNGSVNQQHFDLCLYIDENLPIITTDPTRLSQVLNNLLSNAIKFTNEGSVELHIRKTEETDTHCTLNFQVKDSGIGIPKNRLNQIFESFTQADSTTTRNYGGTGLGLAITQRLVELLGGEIKVNSQFGEGSTFHFTITFPKSEGEVKSTSVKEAESIIFNNEAILYAEDNEINVFVATQMFKKWGLNVTVVNNGKEAIEHLEQNEYKLILMDCQMPVMDGYEATRLIRVSHPDLPILALTASAMEEDQARVMEAGMNGFEVKPFEPDSLNKAIARCLGY